VLTGQNGEDLPEVPGRTVARLALGVRADRIAAELAEQIAAGPIVVSDRGAEMLEERFDPGARGLIESALAYLAVDPDAAVRNGLILQLLRDGYLDSPDLDGDLLDDLEAELDRGLDVWGDDRFEIVVELLP
jgi:hypothetical protein